MPLGNFLRTGKNATMLLAGTMARMIASFAFVVFCADRLGVAGFGQYSIAIHYFELFLSLTATAVGILLTRDIARWPRQARQLQTSAVLLSLALCTFAPAILWAISSLFGYSGVTHRLLLIASVALFPATVCAVFEAVFVARERAEFVTAGIAVESLLRIGVSVWLLIQGYSIISLLWCLVAVRCVLLIAYAIGLRQIGSFGWTFHRRRFARFTRRWRIFAAENWMASIYTNLDIILLSWLAGDVAAGIYSAAWKVVRLGSVAAKSYTTAVFPIMSRVYANHASDSRTFTSIPFASMFALALPAIAVISVIPDRVIGLLFNEEYAAAAPVLQVLIWVLLMEFLNPFLSHVLFAQGQQSRSMRVAGISLVVNLVTSFVLVLQWGAVGAAWGTVIAGAIATGCYFALALPRNEIWQTANHALRVVAAAVGLGMVAYFVRQMSWPQLLLVIMAVYPPLLLLAGALRLDDLRLVRTLFVARAA